jgi:hypothetical protein
MKKIASSSDDKVQNVAGSFRLSVFIIFNPVILYLFFIDPNHDFEYRIKKIAEKGRKMFALWNGVNFNQRK